jgi:hypothetical protein
VRLIEGNKIYEDSDFDPDFADKVKSAEALWLSLIKAWCDERGLYPFFAAMGGGISVRYLGYRKRVPTTKIILRPPMDPSNRLAWMDSGREVAEILKANGIECHLDLGRDD